MKITSFDERLLLRSDREWISGKLLWACRPRPLTSESKLSSSDVALPFPLPSSRVEVRSSSTLPFLRIPRVDFSPWSSDVPSKLRPLVRFLVRDDEAAPKLNSLRGRTPAFSSRRAETPFMMSKKCIGLVLLKKVGMGRLVMSGAASDRWARECDRENEPGFDEEGRECEDSKDDLAVSWWPVERRLESWS